MSTSTTQTGQHAIAYGSYASHSHAPTAVAAPPVNPIPYTYENGRPYNATMKYFMPVDALEMERLDLMHKVFLVARSEGSPTSGDYRERLWEKDPPMSPKILDLGCGTGIWAIDMSRALLEAGKGWAQIVGWDLDFIQPKMIPENTRFEGRDFENIPWRDVQKDSFDLVHMRSLGGCVSNWQALYTECFKHVKPGGGIEHVDIDFRPHTDTNVLPESSKLLRWSNLMHEAMAAEGKPLHFEKDEHIKMLEVAGFDDVACAAKRLPFNAWSTEAHEKMVGRWFHIGFLRGLEAMSLAPLTRRWRMSYDEIMQLVREVQEEIGVKEQRAYCTLYVWTAQRRPQGA
ncbi:methyltransferase LaeA [Xylariomycetidae sp. FL0641]|nr:methyltransferase LaeA [Xylariomycetidae sp. FL0641]